MDFLLQEKLDFFSKLLTCSHDLYYWCYNPKLDLLSTNCPNVTLYEALFALSSCQDYLKEYMQTQHNPLILTDSAGLMWIASFECADGKIYRTHLIGPAFIADISVKTFEKKLSQGEYSLKTKNAILNILHSVPVLAITTYFQYGRMLHYTVTGEKIETSAFQYQSYEKENRDSEYLRPPKKLTISESHGTWAAEQNLMRMIEEGNLDYQDILNKISVTGSTGNFRIGDPLREAKDYMLAFIVLSSRAAMRGGLSPELSYTLSDFYIQSVEHSNHIAEIQEIGSTMYQDYVMRVHDLKMNSQRSRQIQECICYIQLHTEDDINIKNIATQFGYTEYYFSKKFKKEMGISINEYIRQCRIEHAKVLLKSTDETIEFISERLHFCSQSYFAETFRRYTDMTPVEYRLSGGTDLL